MIDQATPIQLLLYFSLTAFVRYVLHLKEMSYNEELIQEPGQIDVFALASICVRHEAAWTV